MNIRAKIFLFFTLTPFFQPLFLISGINFPSINDPPELSINPGIFESDIVFTSENVGDLALAAEVHFSPWELATALTWTHDGEVLAIAAGEQVYLIDVKSWSVLTILEVGSLTLSLDFSPDGNWLAAGSRDGLVRCWFRPIPTSGALPTISPALIIEAHRKGVNDLAFSPDGGTLGSGGNDAVARFWDLNTGELLGLMIGGTFAVPSIAFTPDGAVLAVVNGRMIRLRQVGTERITGSFQADGPLFSLAYSPDGKWLAAGDIQNQVFLWNPEQAFRTGQEQYPSPVLLAAHSGTSGTYQALVWDLTFSPDSQLLASAGGDGTIQLWDIAGALLVSTLRGHTAGVTNVKFNQQSNSLASSGLDGRVILWKIGKRN